MTEEIKVPGKLQAILMSSAGITIAHVITVPCTFYLKHDDTNIPMVDLEPGDFICVIRKRDIKPGNEILRYD
jgi:hypothetical protein